MGLSRILNSFFASGVSAFRQTIGHLEYLPLGRSGSAEAEHSNVLECLPLGRPSSAEAEHSNVLECLPLGRPSSAEAEHSRETKIYHFYL
jgi:hypothetical protein